MTAPVCAVVLAARGGASLAGTLAAVTWAAERAVLDLPGVVRAGDVPDDVHLGRQANELSTLGAASWLLLLAEGEEPAPELPAAAAAVIAGDGAALRPRLELDTLGVRFALPTAPVRVAPRAACRLSVDRACVVGLATPHPSRASDAAIRVHAGESVADAFELLQADGALAAQLLAQVEPAGRTAGPSPLAALGRVLRARADRRAGLARWVAAVFAAYRVAQARARCWEWQHAQPALVREVG